VEVPTYLSTPKYELKYLSIYDKLGDDFWYSNVPFYVDEQLLQDSEDTPTFDKDLITRNDGFASCRVNRYLPLDSDQDDDAGAGADFHSLINLLGRKTTYDKHQVHLASILTRANHKHVSNHKYSSSSYQVKSCTQRQYYFLLSYTTAPIQLAR